MRLKLKLRGIMLAVAVIAVVLGVEMSRRRSAYYRSLAAKYEKGELDMKLLEIRFYKDIEIIKASLHMNLNELNTSGDPEKDKFFAEYVENANQVMRLTSLQVETSRQKASYYRSLKEKYRRMGDRWWPWTLFE